MSSGGAWHVDDIPDRWLASADRLRMAPAGEAASYLVVVEDPHSPSYASARAQGIDSPKRGNLDTQRRYRLTESCSAFGACVRLGSPRTDTPRRRCCTCDVRPARSTRAGSWCATPVHCANDKPRRSRHRSCSGRISPCWATSRVYELVSCAPVARPRSRIHRARRVRTVDRRKCQSSVACCCCRVGSRSYCCSTLVSDLSLKISAGICRDKLFWANNYM